jgi:hypothetical protein
VSSFSDAVERARALSTGFYGAPPPHLPKAKLTPGDYRLSPRVGMFTCKRCDVGEMSPPEAKDHYTAWPCWSCGQDDMTLPRPIVDAEPADTEKAPS